MINSYYLLINGQEVGPHTQYEVMDMNLDVHTIVLSPLASGWQEMLDLPEFAQYLYEKGIYFPTKANLASFWWRLLAYVIDYIVIVVITIIFVTVYYAATGLLTNGYIETDQSQNALNLFSITLMIVYHAVFEATKLRGSIGKIVCKLCVVNSNGTRITFLRALGRNSGKLLSIIILGLGFLNILWDDRRQGWHDQMAKTYIIRR
ncbi:RDD family protein [Mucilaginibacter terrigena]|uniref:RDD family protein n=1 Tax=Mucilaginibacter terrigena TaxID=2492395 RepID=A0A4Q5LHL6_9SPHI|nr:RDD family protein [Mucilaginibacter terrigena]RYU86839.1 RDD family protein [Mucilaginibacter terrigena]